MLSSLLSTVGFAVGGSAILMAGFTFWSAPSDPRNRWLSAYMATAGFSMIVGWGVLHAAGTEATAVAATQASLLAVIAGVPAYLLFLGALPKAANGWLRLRAVRRMLAGSFFGVPLLWLAVRTGALTGVERHPVGVWVVDPGPVFVVFNGLDAATSLGGLLIAVSMVRRSERGTFSRRRSLVYLATFGFIDVTGITYAGGFALLPQRDFYLFAEATLPIATGIGLALLAYCVLVGQVLELDLRLKQVLRQAAVPGLAAAASLLAAGGYVLGIGPGWVVVVVVGGILVIVIGPLRRLGHRLADRAMPGVHDTAEYRRRRRQEVFQAAWEGMLVDGGVTRRQKDSLEALARSLGLTPREVSRVEQRLA